MVEITKELTTFSDKPADLDVFTSKLQGLFKLIYFHSNNIFSLTDSYIQAIDKVSDASDSCYLHQYTGVFESCSQYKNLVVNAKLLISDDLLLLSSTNSRISDIAEKYKHELVMQVARDHHRAQANAQQLSDFIQLSTEYNFLMTRWRRELIEFIGMSFE
jgi:hypothetical protein